MPDGWEAITSKSSGKTYYRNKYTNATQWTLPTEAVPRDEGKGEKGGGKGKEAEKGKKGKEKGKAYGKGEGEYKGEKGKEEGKGKGKATEKGEKGKVTRESSPAPKGGSPGPGPNDPLVLDGDFGWPSIVQAMRTQKILSGDNDVEEFLAYFGTDGGPVEYKHLKGKLLDQAGGDLGKVHMLIDEDQAGCLGFDTTSAQFLNILD